MVKQRRNIHAFVVECGRRLLAEIPFFWYTEWK